MSLDFKKEKDNDISGRNSLICATYTMIMDQGQKLKKKVKQATYKHTENFCG